MGFLLGLLFALAGAFVGYVAMVEDGTITLISGVVVIAVACSAMVAVLLAVCWLLGRMETQAKAIAKAVNAPSPSGMADTSRVQAEAQHLMDSAEGDFDKALSFANKIENDAFRKAVMDRIKALASGSA